MPSPRRRSRTSTAIGLTYPHTTLQASGEAVGLPDGQMGNSEVGHLNIGAGRIVYQDLTRMTKSIREGSFFENDTVPRSHPSREGTTEASFTCTACLSDGGVHSHIDHLFALLELAKQERVEEVYVHAFLDGRDVAPDSGVIISGSCRTRWRSWGSGKIATVQGRYYAMDRDQRWERTEKSYRAMVYGEGPRYRDPVQAVKESYEKSGL